jgi:hypothetical protein
MTQFPADPYAVPVLGPWRGDDSAISKSAAPRFRLVAFRDIKLSSSAVYLVRGIIPREGLVVVYGAPKCGKTFKVTDIAFHIALGWEYRGRRVTQGTVVYIACEGERGLAARVEAFRRARLQEAGEDVPFYLLTTRLDLAVEHPALIADIRAQLGDRPCAAIVIDTLNRSLGGSESSDEDMSAYVKGADAIREAFRCAVIVIHHCGLDDKRPRGHTSLTGAADAQIAVKRDDSDVIVATVEYMKDGEAGSEFRSRLEVVELDDDEDGEAVTSCVIQAVEGGDSRAKRRKPPTGAAKLGLEKLHECIIDLGRSAPASDRVPAGVIGVTLTQWRDYLARDAIINPEGGYREQFRRIRVTLETGGFIGVAEDFVWPVT